MKSLLTGICTTAALAFSLSVFAQTPSQPQPQPSPSQPATPPSTQQPTTQPQSMDASAEQVTLTGCVQSEADFRRAKGMAKGGPASSGVGVGNEFVIIDASKSSSASGAATPADAPAGTSGAAAGNAFEATGSGEGDLKQYVGKRVEITGKIKRAERSAAGAPTGGVDPAGQDLQLQEIDIASVKPAAGECKPNQ
jgi:hypothetical protein